MAAVARPKTAPLAKSSLSRSRSRTSWFRRTARFLNPFASSFPGALASAGGLDRSGEAYQLFSTKTLEVIAIQPQALSVIPVDFTIRNGEVRWDTPGLEEVESRRTFVGGGAINFPRFLAVEIEQQVGERF